MSDDKCLGCDKKFKAFNYLQEDPVFGLCSVNIITHCARCRNLLLKREALKQKLLEMDFKISNLANKVRKVDD
jgi:hypothetical protein